MKKISYHLYERLEDSIRNKEQEIQQLKESIYNLTAKVSELTIESEQAKEDAIGFVRWANQNGWYKHADLNDDCWSNRNREYIINKDNPVTVTTSDLFDKYKQSITEGK